MLLILPKQLLVRLQNHSNNDFEGKLTEKTKTGQTDLTVFIDGDDLQPLIKVIALK